MSGIAFASPQPVRPGRRMAGFAAIVALGVPAALSVALVVPGLVEHAARGKPVPLPMPLIQLIVVAQSLALIVACALLGAFAAPASALRSIVFSRYAGGPPAARVAVALAAGTGVVVFAFSAAVDLLLMRYSPGSWDALQSSASDRAASLAAGLLYGGIGEEIIVRWGLLSTLAWLAWKTFARGRTSPPPAILSAAVLLSALLFAAGHLPALFALSHGDVAVLVARTLALNTVAGCALGWLFVRFNLETAMLAHAAFHLALFLARLVLP